MPASTLKRSSTTAYDPQISARTRIDRIVSGGQTGADRAALDFAINNGIPYGGWCPKGGWAEDMTNPPGLLGAYPHLRETPTGDVQQRTIWNVRDSDGTLIFTRAPHVHSPGTALTKEAAMRLCRPCMVVDVAEPSASPVTAGFLERLPQAATLNIAGPRESEAPGIYREVRALLDLLFAEAPAR